VKLFVRRSCPFSPLAIERTQQLAAEDRRIALTIIDADIPSAVFVLTPVLVLPNGARVTGMSRLQVLPVPPASRVRSNSGVFNRPASSGLTLRIISSCLM
jgi:hypothetical protein